MTLQQQYQELVDAGYTPDEARSYVVPAGDSQYSTNELINKGGFIGDPNQPGSNAFDPTLGRQTTNVLPHWMVEPAGQSAAIPGINAQSALDFQDAYGIDPRKLEDERKVVIGTLSGSEEPPPQKEIDAIDAGYKDAFNRLGPILAAGADAKEAVDSLYGPLRSEAKSLMLGGRHKQSTPKEKEESFIIQKGRFGIEPDLTARLTPSGFLGQIQYLPEYSRTNAANLAILRGAGLIAGAGGIELAGGNKPSAATSFKTEAQARASGAVSGDVVYLDGIGKVRLR